MFYFKLLLIFLFILGPFHDTTAILPVLLSVGEKKTNIEYKLRLILLFESMVFDRIENTTDYIHIIFIMNVKVNSTEHRLLFGSKK